MVQTAEQGAATGKVLKTGGREVARKFIPFAALALLIVIFGIAAPDRFMTFDNARTVLVQTVVLAIVAFGSTLVIIAGSIDLSVGSVAALSSMVGASVAMEVNGLAGLIAAIVVGMIAGAANGIGLAYLKVPSFIMTLGMLSVARGLTLLYSGTQPIMTPGDWDWMGVAPGIYIPGIVVFIATFCLFGFTAFGRYVSAVGGQEKVASMSGVRVNQVKVLVFVISGITAAIGGVVLASRVGAATPMAGTGMELTVIAAVVLGGTPLTGGMGSLVNTIVGALIINILLNGLIIVGIGAELQIIAQGLVLFAAVLVSLDRKKIGIIK
ncbi:MAG: ABC transporter permease [Bauldia sp.]|uniref:ABC transporter permease n=1 Tax=Bauldia sp. TaxID=2575872 RepID=UPI001DBBF991|nr:ABC transporter permease [Bauldia sp.]MCB1495986.1 ABC transporter permease [Bauldia sp.]